MEAAEDVEEGRDVTGESPTENRRDRILLDIEARQQVLLENVVICDHMLAQLHRLRHCLADTETPETESKILDQPESENIAKLQSDKQDPTPKVVPGAE